jgi:hypothetical protein
MATRSAARPPWKRQNPKRTSSSLSRKKKNGSQEARPSNAWNQSIIAAPMASTVCTLDHLGTEIMLLHHGRRLNAVTSPVLSWSRTPVTRPGPKLSEAAAAKRFDSWRFLLQGI